MCTPESMLSTCKEEWKRKLNTAIQTVHQRVLDCKLGIISNWVFQCALVKICHFEPPSPRLYSEASQNVSCCPSGVSGIRSDSFRQHKCYYSL